MTGNKCVIIGGAPSPYISDIAPEDFVICADRGYTEAKKRGIKVSVIIGDFDSLTDELPDDAEIVKLPPVKDDTDMMIAVKTAIERGFKEIDIYGATGGRLDHTFANIQTLAYAKKHSDALVRIIDEQNTMLMLKNEEMRFNKTARYISCFAYTESVDVSNSGVKYPLEKAHLTPFFPLGVSNEILGESGTMKAENGILLIVISDEK